MSKKTLGIFVIFVFLLLSEFAMAQMVSVPYFCGFEDATDNSHWKMNVGPTAGDSNDKWLIGNIDSSEGYNSLTITCDSGKTATFGAERNMMVAYRRFQIDTTLSVNISFDWKCEGIEDISQCHFYFLPASAIAESELYSLSNTATLPLKLSRPQVSLSGSVDWMNVFACEQLDLQENVEYYMIFAWQNANTDTAQNVLSKYSVSIDNIQITSATCPEPENLRYKSACDTLFLWWDGATELYEFQYKPSGDKVWKTLPKTREKKTVLVGIQEGAYDVRVRGVHETTNEFSAWRALNEVVCFCPERHCINFVELDRPGVECLWGEASNPADIKLAPTGVGNTGAGPYDKGSRDIRSRHTVNWRQGDRDPRTGNLLRTIPEGHLASVRLGNWDIGKQAEGIVFDYVVDTAQADIILMKYAVVLENPGHGPTEDPYFKLEILDEGGMIIDADCGAFDFTPQNKNIKWNRNGGFVWKDWTAIGLNLAAHHGKSIKIRLITQDCVRTAHCGYAYFTLDCVDASIKTTSCGETVEIKMEAPDGFEYLWTRGDDREPVPGGTSKTIDIPADDIETYYCEVSYVGIEGCGFELHTEVKPRFPFADFASVWKPENCENKIMLNNKSCVHTRIDGVDTPTSEPCETFYWKIDDGQDVYEYISEDVEYKVPNVGATLQVTLVSYISSGACEDDTTITVVVPAISSDYCVIDTTICEGDYIQTNFGAFANDTVVFHTEKSKWCGCDSTTELRLTILPQPEEVHVYDTICSGQPYSFRGKNVELPGEHRFVFPMDSGCDSVFVLHLEMIEPMSDVVLDSSLFVCADDKKLSIGYDFIGGSRQPSGCSILFSDLAKDNGFVDLQKVEMDYVNNQLLIDIPQNCRPNKYSATLLFKDTTGMCGDASFDISFDVYYSSSILQPKFGNTIALYDSAHNGGYSFVESEYQWYKNNEILLDDTLSYLYLGIGEEFAVDDCYYLELMRKDDGVVMRTCEICPGMDTDIDDVYALDELLPITLFAKNQRIVIDNLEEGVVGIFTLTGQLVNEYHVKEFDSMIVAPSQAGTYVLRVITSDYTVGYKIQVK